LLEPPQEWLRKHMKYVCKSVDDPRCLFARPTDECFRVGLPLTRAFTHAGLHDMSHLCGADIPVGCSGCGQSYKPPELAVSIDQYSLCCCEGHLVVLHQAIMRVTPPVHEHVWCKNCC
jgi:hypothetical protein